jgi:hypothetical protein
MCLLLAGVAVQADEDTSEQAPAAEGLRIQIDGKTGKKTLPDDSPQQANRAAASQSAAASRQAAELAKVSARTGLPVERQLLRRNADGSVSAHVGLKDMKYMVMTIDKDGKRTITHRTLDEAEKAPAAQATDSGEK